MICTAVPFSFFAGSLPCDVNSSVIPARDYQFLEEARRNKAMKNKEYTAIDMESESLLEHDSLAQNYQEQTSPIEMVLPGATKFTTKATLQICKYVGVIARRSRSQVLIHNNRYFYRLVCTFFDDIQLLKKYYQVCCVVM